MTRYLRYFFLVILTNIILLAQSQQIDSLEIHLPKINPGDQVVTHTGFTLCYNEKHEQASWVAYQLTKAETISITERTNRFLTDPFVPTGSASDADYKGSGFDRGHLAPAADMGWSMSSMAASFYYSNMSPQTPAFNRGIWKNLESLVRSWAVTYDVIEVVTGPILTAALPNIGPNHVSVPAYYYKVILDNHPQHQQAIGFILPNQGSRMALNQFVVSVDSIESLTGIDFFPLLQDATENMLEKSVCIPCWTWQTNSTKFDSTPGVQTGIYADKEIKNNFSVQCEAITKAGNRCKRMTKNKSGLCWQHERMKMQNN